MDFTVENGYKCGLCPKRLASKYSLERHIRLKHKSELEENTSPAKKPKLEIEEQMQENVDIDKLDVKKASDQESDNNTELDRNNNKVVYANNAGWVETDNKEELDNNSSGSEDSNMESDNTEDVDNMDLDNNEEIDNSDNKDPDNNKDIDKSESEESIMEDMQCTKELDFKHNLFDVIYTCKDMCDKFGNCGNLATFRIHPSPVGMGNANKYI